MEAGELFAGRYRIVRFIARGGMGEVHEAHDELLDTTVALKRVGFAGLPDDEAALARARVLREARLAARLRGVPQVVSTYDVIESGDDVWLVLEYVPSTTLADAATVRLDPVAVARIGAAVATALAAAHRADVLHRDVKPGNVLLGDDGAVKLTDFGISRGTGDATVLTDTDVVSGTPAYMAAEIARGEDPSPASDVYSLGATLYRAVEGVPPHGADGNALRLMYRVATEPPRPPEHAETLAPLLERLLAGDPAARPDAATAAELLDAAARRPTEPTEPTVREPQPDPSSGTPPGTLSESPPGTSSRTSTPTGRDGPAPSRRRVWLLVAAAAVVLAVAAATVLLVSGDAGDPLTLPTTVAARSLDVPAAAADPCALLDADALGRFGAVRLGPASAAAGCEATVTGSGGSGTVTATFQTPGTRPPENATVTTLGAAQLASAPDTAPAGAEGCPRVLTIADGTQVRVTGSAQGLTAAGSCTLADAGIALAARAIDAHGITADLARPDRLAFGRRDACELVPYPDRVRAVPDLSVAQGTRGFANWSCAWGSRSQVTVYFSTDDDRLDDYGVPTSTPGGRRAWTTTEPDRCRAWVLVSPAIDDRPAALMQAAVAGSPGAARCGAAIALADVMASRLAPA